jgi:diacylglycerol kinase family enzyme
VPGIGVVVNPHAGQNRGVPDRAQLFADAAGGDGLVRATGSLQEIEEVAREFHRQRIDVLAVCGGDGSFFRTLTAIVRAYGSDPLPHFLPLRAGSMNTIARSVGCRHGSPERVLTDAVADYRAGRPFETTERHLIIVNGQDLGFMFGAGAIVSFLRVYYGGRGRGPLAAAQLVARVAASGLTGSALARGLSQTTEADVECDGERVPCRRFNVIYASTITEIGLGFKATYLATRKRGFFHLIAGRLEVMQVLRRLRRLRRGQPLEVDDFYDNLAQRVTVEFPRPTQYTIDGDILEAVTRLEVVTGPRLTIICR